MTSLSYLVTSLTNTTDIFLRVDHHRLGESRACHDTGGDYQVIDVTIRSISNASLQYPPSGKGEMSYHRSWLRKGHCGTGH